MGGIGGGIAFTDEDFERIAQNGLNLSPVSEILIETSILGWKEYEMEVMRDKKDNVVIICSIENIDAMGVHTGDSITVAPAQTLTDKEYQRMRDASIAVMRVIGVETGGSNVQFAVNPKNGEMVVIEMNPRVSRSSALASKATGFPIAKIAAKLAVGYTLDELQNDITKETPACFEPSIDYVVTKVPRFTFEKFPQAAPVLGTQMKSVGEAMAMGRSFKESLQKAMRSLELGYAGLGADGKRKLPDSEIENNLNYKNPGIERILSVKRALELGWTVEKIQQVSGIDPWFINHIRELVEFEKMYLIGRKLASLSSEVFLKAKQHGYSDRQIAYLTQNTEGEVRKTRLSLGIRPVYKTVDTCAAEFVAYTPYHYSTYELENESIPSDRPKVLIIGGGPNRIGQGIEFDYCCCHASFALQESGVESIMVNSNPETVSTDYDTSDKLYFEPLGLEEILNIVELEKPMGVIVQFGGQTPLKLAVPLEQAGVPIIGTSPASIELAEDRKLFAEVITELGIRQPPNGIALSADQALEVAKQIGYPVLVRPSFVLGGRAMMIVYNEDDLRVYMHTAVEASETRPVLIDKFLDHAEEFDVDVISDGQNVVVAGLMQHIEEAGVHSGDSACALPPYNLPLAIKEELITQSIALAKRLKVKGLMNIQYALQGQTLYILEANPRASRTIPFVSKAIGKPLAKFATKIMLGKTLPELGFTHPIVPHYTSIKESVFPFAKFHGVDTLLSPEMKSTGEVMGVDFDRGLAFAKSQLGAGNGIKKMGKVFISVAPRDRESIIPLAQKVHLLGFPILATVGTGAALQAQGIPCEIVRKVHEGSPHVLDLMKQGSIGLLINTTSGQMGKIDDMHIRREALVDQIPYTTTLAAAREMVQAMESLSRGQITVTSIQEFHRQLQET